MIRPTRTTGGIAALALALTATALLLDNPAAVLAAGALCLFLFWRAWRFDRDFRTAAASLAVEREVDRIILRQGAEAHVRMTVDLAIPDGMEVRVRDVPPAVAAGEAPFCEPGRTAAYTIRLLSHGRTAFGGIVLSARDAYFSNDLLVRRFSAPSLRIFPVGAAEASGEKRAGISNTEVDRRSTLDGPSVRGFRRYQVGDGLGWVDWKVSARRGALYVREMTGLESGIPLLAVDLPTQQENGQEVSERYMMVVCDAVERAMESREGCSLLIITSGEVLRFLPWTENLREALAALGEGGPAEPRVPLYRAPGPAVLAARARLRRGDDGREGTYIARLGGVLAAFAAESRSPFGAAVGKALDRVEATEVHLYTPLVRGDKSHLAQITHQAKIREMQVVLRAPAGWPVVIPGVDVMEVI
ncbi:MAG: DUF58 domain-containing protein [Methanoculleus sp.]|nr:DUF58 domain-containing protein [Methanoculleus sp.]